jgi:release factor glutamine methyltransferase
MNKNLTWLNPTIDSWLQKAAVELKKAGINSSRLDAELILSYILKQPRTYLHSYGDKVLQRYDYKKAEKYLKQRLSKLPLAYITECKEFYGRSFYVTPDTLIPRPESETLIDSLLEITQQVKSKSILNFIDVGTGCGCLGIIAKLERPFLDVTLLDISSKALKAAIHNAKLLKASVNIKKSDLLNNYSKSPDIIMANLPYLDKSWQRSPETNYEPELALFADKQGLGIINKLIIQAAQRLPVDGFLILEADLRQHQSLIEYAKQYDLILVKKIEVCLVLRRD